MKNHETLESVESLINDVENCLSDLKYARHKIKEGTEVKSPPEGSWRIKSRNSERTIVGLSNGKGGDHGEISVGQCLTGDTKRFVDFLISEHNSQIQELNEIIEGLK